MKRTTIKLLGFDEHTFVDLVGMVYEVFPQGKDEVLLEEQRLRRRSEKNCLDVPETFCRVLSLLVETYGRLLPPLEMMSSSSKAPPWSAKEVPHSSNLS